MNENKQKKIIENIFKYLNDVEIIQDLGNAVVSIVFALLIGGIIILFIGQSPIAAYQSLFMGAFGSIKGLAATLTKSVPLLFTGLAVGVALRCGLFNIGGEGQLYLGAFVSAVAAIYLSEMPRWILLPLVILLGMLAGAIWGGLAGALKAKFGIHEVIVTVMMNYIAIEFTSYLVNYPFKAQGMVAQTEKIPAAAALHVLIPKTQLTSGLLIGWVVAILVYVLLWKTAAGFEIRATGENPMAAQAAGINTALNTIKAMTISGGIAALAGVIQSLGLYGRFIDNFSPGWGFTGIAVAVLGKNHPLGIILTSILFGALDAGALQMNRETAISAKWVVVIQGLIILFVAIPTIVKAFKNK